LDTILRASIWVLKLLIVKREARARVEALGLWFRIWSMNDRREVTESASLIEEVSKVLLVTFLKLPWCDFVVLS
jgi:hypothetical protein